MSFYGGFISNFIYIMKKELTMRFLIMLICWTLLTAFGAAAAMALDSKDLAAEKAQARNGDVMSQVNVGDYYYARAQYAEALKWYQLAAKQGQFDSRMRIARMYENGKGVPQDLVKAYVLHAKILQNYRLYPESQASYEQHVKELAARLSPAQMADAEKRILEAWEF